MGEREREGGGTETMAAEPGSFPLPELLLLLTHGAVLVRKEKSQCWRGGEGRYDS